MKVEKKKAEPEFVPVVITLETLEESEAIFALMNHSKTASFLRAMLGEIGYDYSGGGTPAKIRLKTNYSNKATRMIEKLLS